jgi:hypothetical protein
MSGSTTTVNQQRSSITTAELLNEIHHHRPDFLPRRTDEAAAVRSTVFDPASFDHSLFPLYSLLLKP